MTEDNAKTWDPLRGCRRISPGCDHCCAERQAARPILSGPGKPYDGLVRIRRASMFGNPLGPQWTGSTAGPDRLDEPLRWKKGRTIFVCSMGDLFYEGHTNEQIAAVFGVMAACPQHTFHVLTKRAERMERWFEWAARQIPCWSLLERNRMVNPQSDPEAACRSAAHAIINDGMRQEAQNLRYADRQPWPLPNVWIGVSVEDQQRARERLPHLLRVPAAVRFVSYEPALGPVDFGPWLGAKCQQRPSIDHSPETCSNEAHYRRGIDWLIIGGESGPSARPLDLAWVRAARKQCLDNGTAFFFKQAGRRPYEQTNRGRIGEEGDSDWDYGWLKLKDRNGADLLEWPADLQVREWPATSG